MNVVEESNNEETDNMVDGGGCESSDYNPDNYPGFDNLGIIHTTTSEDQGQSECKNYEEEPFHYYEEDMYDYAEVNDEADMHEFAEVNDDEGMHEYAPSQSEEESDSEYAPSEIEEETESESKLDTEDEAEQAQYIPELNDFIHGTFECIEENPCNETPTNFEDDIELFEGQEFDTIKDARDHVRLYSVKKKFQMKFKVNNVDKLICICKASTCPWRCYIKRTNDDHTCICRSLTEVHTCVNDGQNRNCQATTDWIALLIEDEIKRHHTSFTGGDIIKLVWHKYQVSINYWKAWFARGKALEKLYGNYETSYMRVPDMCRQILEKNPGN